MGKGGIPANRENPVIIDDDCRIIDTGSGGKAIFQMD
jgi:hypothetical protein